jgi:hypothetical protein
VLTILREPDETARGEHPGVSPVAHFEVEGVILGDEH